MFDNKLVAYAGLFNGSLNEGQINPTRLGKNQIYHINTAGFKGAAQPTGLMYSGRIEYSPFGKFKKTQGDFDGESQAQVGINYYGQTLGSSVSALTSGLNSNSAIGVDAAYRGYGASIEAEWIARTLAFNATNAATGARDVKQKAYSIQGGYMVLPKLELAARYENIDFDDKNVYTGSKGQSRAKEITFGANYYIKKHHMKIQANYVKKNLTGTTNKDDQVLITSNYYF